MKTGACRYGTFYFVTKNSKLKGMQCKRVHIIPLCSETILIERMYKDTYNKMKGVTKGLDDSLLEVLIFLCINF